MTMRKTFLIGIFFLSLLLTQCRRTEAVKPVRKEMFVLDTVCQFTFYTNDYALAEEDGFRELLKIEEHFDRHNENSELGKINRNLSQTLSADMEELLGRAFYYADLTDGLFNPAIGPLVDLWDVGSENPRIPGDEEIKEALKLTDWRKIEFQNNGVPYLPPGLSLDLGGIAKGYAADKIKTVFESHGIKSAIINLGGNVLVMGTKPDGSLWKIGVQNPQSVRGEYVGILKLEDSAMVTSGNYERFFEQDGIRYHHIIDARTGSPVRNGLASVTVVASLSTDADALSTSLYAMGLKEGMKFSEENDFFEAIFITDEKEIYMTKGIQDIFTLTDSTFTVSTL